MSWYEGATPQLDAQFRPPVELVALCYQCGMTRKETSERLRVSRLRVTELLTERTNACLMLPSIIAWQQAKFRADLARLVYSQDAPFSAAKLLAKL